MNNRHGRARFNKFQPLFDIGCSFIIVTGGLVEKPHPGKYSVMQWHTQAVSITNNHQVKVDFT